MLSARLLQVVGRSGDKTVPDGGCFMLDGLRELRGCVWPRNSWRPAKPGGSTQRGVLPSARRGYAGAFGRDVPHRKPLPSRRKQKGTARGHHRRRDAPSPKASATYVYPRETRVDEHLLPQPREEPPCHLFRPFYVWPRRLVKRIIDRSQPLEGRAWHHLHMWLLGVRHVAIQPILQNAHPAVRQKGGRRNRCNTYCCALSSARQPLKGRPTATNNKTHNKVSDAEQKRRFWYKGKRGYL